MVSGRRIVISVGWSAVAGFAFGLLGFGFGAVYPLTAGMTPFIVLGGVAAFVIGGVFWGLFVEHPSRPTLGRGILVGALTGTFAHPMMWLLFSLLLSFPVVGHSSTDLLIRMGAVALVLGLIGLLVTGMLTIAVGVVGGAVLVVVRRHLPDKIR